MIKKIELEIDVVQAARERVKNIFSSGLKINLSFSGGKDSLVLADVVYKLAASGEIDKKLLTVLFLDEEAIYDETVEIVKKWRKKWMQIGVKFDWYCIEVKNFNCLNSLVDQETYISWDRNKKDSWIRPMPEFAITNHPLLIPVKDNYQTFFSRLDKENGSVTMIGNRAAESLQRMKNMAHQKSALAAGARLSPVYDWKDTDVWLYIKQNNIEIPGVYENLYRIGTKKNGLRMTQFFSIDSVRALVGLNEIYPELMKRVSKREPNAYLVSLYWDSEMFHRSTATRRKLEGKLEEEVDYRNKFISLIKNPKMLTTENQRTLAVKYKTMMVKFGFVIDNKIYKKMYEAILTGDPKFRTFRAIFISVVQANSLDKGAKKTNGK
jgi:predicted phosphoadenosine phosphosulfate sulfurtransferase